MNSFNSSVVEFLNSVSVLLKYEYWCMNPSNDKPGRINTICCLTWRHMVESGKQLVLLNVFIYICISVCVVCVCVHVCVYHIIIIILHSQTIPVSMLEVTLHCTKGEFKRAH